MSGTSDATTARRIKGGGPGSVGATAGARSRPPARGPIPPGMPVAKPLDFKASGRRFLGLLRPERVKVALTMVLTVIAVGLGVVGPKILGEATNRVFEGFMGKLVGAELVRAGILQPGETMPKAQVMELLESVAGRAGPEPPPINTSVMDMLGAMDFTAGQGVDFAAVGWILVGLLAMYVGSTLLGYWQGIITAQIIQDSMYRLRAEVEAKL
ncbi:MAG: hypothetical protein LBO20_05740, partial [Bifidobacteriaceae bacterium]|nr:hypothetical protein [Bifidobacteriaceae bacterium]